jgi:hypothetical protein
MSDQEYGFLILFCVGFATGAGVIPYSKAVELIEKGSMGVGEEE